MPYPEFSIIELDLRTFEHRRILTLPETTQEFRPRAFSQKGDEWYFICPDYSNDVESKHVTHLVKLRPNLTLETLEQFDYYSAQGKGIMGGRFFLPYSGGTVFRKEMCLSGSVIKGNQDVHKRRSRTYFFRQLHRRPTTKYNLPKEEA